MKAILTVLVLLLAYAFPARVDAREIRVAVGPDMKPLHFHDEDGKLVGYEIDLINEYARKRDHTIKYMYFNDDAEIVKSLTSNEADIGVNGFTRSYEGLFDSLIINSGLGIVTRQDVDVKTLKFNGKYIVLKNNNNALNFVVRKKFNYVIVNSESEVISLLFDEKNNNEQPVCFVYEFLTTNEFWKKSVSLEQQDYFVEIFYHRLIFREETLSDEFDKKYSWNFTGEGIKKWFFDKKILKEEYVTNDINEYLEHSIVVNDIETQNFILSYGADPNKINANGSSPLMVAVEHRKLESVRILIKYGADVNFMAGRNPESILSSSVESGNIELVKELIKSGANVKLNNGDGGSALIKAIEKKKYAIAEYLISGGADLSAYCYGSHGMPNKIPTLVCATQDGNAKLVSMIHNRDGTGRNYAYMVAKEKNRKDLMEILRNNPRNLVEAAATGNKDAVVAMLDRGDYVDQRDGDGLTPLIWAARNREADVFKILLSAGANPKLEHKVLHVSKDIYTIALYSKFKPILVELENYFKRSELITNATLLNDFDRVKELINDSSYYKGLYNKKGETPLLIAAENGYYEIVKYLIDNGYFLYEHTATGMSPFSKAVANNHYEIVKLFLQKGIIRQSDTQKYVSNIGVKEIRESADYIIRNLKLIENNPLPINNKHVVAAFLLSAEMGYVETVKVFIDHGVDVNSRDELGRTALMLSIWGNYPEVSALLISNGAIASLKDQFGRRAVKGGREAKQLTVPHINAAPFLPYGYLDSCPAEIIVHLVGTLSPGFKGGGVSSNSVIEVAIGGNNKSYRLDDTSGLLVQENKFQVDGEGKFEAYFLVPAVRSDTYLGGCCYGYFPDLQLTISLGEVIIGQYRGLKQWLGYKQWLGSGFKDIKENIAMIKHGIHDINVQLDGMPPADKFADYLEKENVKLTCVNNMHPCSISGDYDHDGGADYLFTADDLNGQVIFVAAMSNGTFSLFDACDTGNWKSVPGKDGDEVYIEDPERSYCTLKWNGTALEYASGEGGD